MSPLRVSMGVYEFVVVVDVVVFPPIHFIDISAPTELKAALYVIHT